MKQSILKHGDMVKALVDTDVIQQGQRYLVQTLSDGGLGIVVLLGTVELVDSRGQLTDQSDNVTKVACPLVLPIGQANGQ